MEEIKAAAVGGDGSVIIVGNAGVGTQGFAAVKVDADGERLWTWQVFADVPYHSVPR